MEILVRKLQLQLRLLGVPASRQGALDGDLA